MKQVLGKKQSSRNEDFVNAWNNIEQLVSREEAERLVASAVSDIREKTAGKRVAYAWSGGKDSLALQVVCERAGINQCVLCTASKIEYPGFVDWCKAHAPKGLTIVDNTKLDIKWVSERPEYLFPSDSKYAASWFHHLQHRGQAIYFKEHQLDIICLGRRIQDGNYTGGKGKNIYTDSKGVTRFSPISHWKHEEVLAVIHYFLGHQLPPHIRYQERLRGRHRSMARPPMGRLSSERLAGAVGHQSVNGARGGTLHRLSKRVHQQHHQITSSQSWQ